jgi:hypothetical protein
VWEFLLFLVAHACTRAGWGGALPLNHEVQEAKESGGLIYFRVWFIHFFLKAFSYQSALKSEFMERENMCDIFMHAL